MHAVSVARELNIPEVVVPYFPGGFSAFGMIVSRKRVEYSASAVEPLAALGVEGMNQMIDALSANCRADLLSQGVAEGDITISVSYYGMYGGQSWDSRIPVGRERLGEGDIDRLTAEFHEFYLDRFGYKAEEMPVIVTSVAVTGFGPEPNVALPDPEVATGGDRTVDDAVLQRATLYLDRQEHHDVAFYDRSKLFSGDTIAGPAVIDDKLGTIAVNGGATARVGKAGTLHIEC
jgi:N-methylhydantoinase A